MSKIMKTINSDNLISLWILIDHHGRIYYTGQDKNSTCEYNHNFLRDKKLQVVELTGSYEKTNTGTKA